VACNFLKPPTSLQASNEPDVEADDNQVDDHDKANGADNSDDDEFDGFDANSEMKMKLMM
jgi:hypothetical protein